MDEPKKYSWSSRTLEATGILSFLIEPNGYYQKVINDGQDKLEDKIKSIILKLEEFGAYRREEHKKNQEWHRQWEEKQRIEKEIKEKKDKEISDFKTIFQRAFRYHQSEILRNYVSTIEKKSLVKQDDELTNWVKWAQEKIDWFDPLVNRTDPVLDDHDKAEIFTAFLKEWL